MGAAVRGRRALRASGVSDVTNVTSGACFPSEPLRAGARARVANVQRYRRCVAVAGRDRRAGGECLRQ